MILDKPRATGSTNMSTFRQASTSSSVFSEEMSANAGVVSSEFGSEGSATVPFTLEGEGSSLFSACPFLITDGVAKNSCKAKSERNRYSIVIVFTTSS